MQTRRNHLHAVPERRYRHIREAKERVGSINSKFGKWQVHNHSFYHEMIMSLVQDGVILSASHPMDEMPGVSWVIWVWGEGDYNEELLESVISIIEKAGGDDEDRLELKYQTQCEKFYKKHLGVDFEAIANMVYVTQ